MPRRLASLLLALAACAAPQATPTPAPRCNGHEALCARRYDQVAYPTAHNAFSAEEESFVAANQHFGLEQQLQDGVRAMMLDVYAFEGGTYLCHGKCAWGKRPLDDALSAIRAFLDANPGEVLTFQFEAYVPGDVVAASFERSGLVRYVYTHRENEPWPTLGEMVTAGTRVVAFYEDRDVASPNAPAWYQPLFRNSFDTPFSAAKPEDLKCVVGRGTQGAALFTLNHFLTRGGGAPDLAEQVNHDPFLIDRARECQRVLGHVPNFVAVDYYDIGDLFAAVRAINGL